MNLLNRANTASRLGQFDQAIQLYQEAMRRYPDLAHTIGFTRDLVVRKAAAQHLREEQHALYAWWEDKGLSVLRLLFVLPGPVDCNNGYHVQLLVRLLEASDLVRCTIAVPDAVYTADSLHSQPYSTLTAQGSNLAFDLIHAWTPREMVRKLCKTLLQRHQCPLLVHLEDNEEYLTATMVGRSFRELAALPEPELDRLIPQHCYHPLRGYQFLLQAQGLTLIVDTLTRFGGPDMPRLVIAPPVDEHLFYPRPLNLALRRSMDIADDQVVLVYTGNVHAGNVGEVWELYKAVNLLNRQGISTLLLRTGKNACGLNLKDWNRQDIRHLGWVERAQVPEILAAADVLVQPGAPGPFNDQRIPCKLPEYFAMGRPVILPRTNLGLQVEHARQGYVVEQADAATIASAVRKIVSDKPLHAILSKGATELFRNRLASSRTQVELLRFHGAIVSQSIRKQISLS
ncbi:MAG: glycosyltransferase [Desulfobulbus sp.]|nr:glycosyltransferase [Desulfobulbus sp.]